MTVNTKVSLAWCIKVLVSALKNTVFLEDGSRLNEGVCLGERCFMGQAQILIDHFGKVRVFFQMKSVSALTPVTGASYGKRRWAGEWY